MPFSFIDILNEANLPQFFDIEINGEIFKIIRDDHLLEIRKGENKPKDFKMSKNKYQKLISLTLNYKTNLLTCFIWGKDGKFNGISIIKTDNKIRIIGAIMNAKKEESIYPKAKNRILLGKQDI